MGSRLAGTPPCLPLPDTIQAPSSCCTYAVGNATYILKSVTSECFSSLAATNSSSSDGSSDGGGGGTPSWVWAVVGSVAGVAALAAVGGAWWWHRRRRRAADAAAAGKLGGDLALTEAGATAGSIDSTGKDHTGELGLHSTGTMNSAGSGGVRGSGDLQSTLLRTRFGPIDGVELGELLGRGAFGKVFKGRWRGAIVAVKASRDVGRGGAGRRWARRGLAPAALFSAALTLRRPWPARTHATGG